MGLHNTSTAKALASVTPSWHGAGEKEINPAKNYGVMGILNLTPDSFYDGGRHVSCEAALRQALAIRDAGADILDIGAESSRPGAQQISAREEIQRLAEVLEKIRQMMPEVIISVDTVHADTAAFALDSGAFIINDVSACRVDPELMDVLVERKPGYVLMHNKSDQQNMQSAPHYSDVCGEVMYFFERELGRLVAAGLPEDHIVLDPGIGFGKTLEHNLELLVHVEEFLKFGRPLLVGISMKSFFGELLGLPLAERSAATQTASALLWERGVYWHRVHDVRAAKSALGLAAALSHD